MNHTTSVLILTGKELSMTNIVTYIPKEKLRPSQQFIEAVYIAHHSWNYQKSECRKQQILQEIAGTKKDIRNYARKVYGDVAENLITACASNLQEQSRQREYKMKVQAAIALGKVAKKISYELLKKEKNIVTINEML